MPRHHHQHIHCSPLVIPLTVGAVAAAAVLALLESDLGRAHCWMICCEYERYSLGVEMSP